MSNQPDRLTGMAAQMTSAQVRRAMEIAGESGFNSPVEPAFVAAVITAMAINAQTIELRAAITSAAQR